MIYKNLEFINKIDLPKGWIGIVDNFYDNPMQVRQTALQSDYEEPPGMVPGMPQIGGAARRCMCLDNIEEEARQAGAFIGHYHREQYF